MTFFRRLRLADLIEVCRSLRYALTSGLMLRDAVDLLAKQGTRRVRLLAVELAKELRAGWSLQDALAKQAHLLPPLFLSLVAVGEESGNLPEVLIELEKYYVLRQKLRREFTEQIAWPVLQFVAALLIVTALIYILGMLPTSGFTQDKSALDPLGLGLIGPRGSVVFLTTVCGTLAALVVVFLSLKRLLRGRALVERTLLVLPAIGPCLRATALARFCVSARLMLETSLSVLKTLRLAFLATDNAAFVAASPRVEASLRQGNSIFTSFGRARLFPPRFLSAVGVAEESGRLPEALRSQAEEYDDEARRRLGWLTRVASWLVWLAVAIIIIVCVITIFRNVYLKNIERALPQTPKKLPAPPKGKPMSRSPARSGLTRLQTVNLSGTGTEDWGVWPRRELSSAGGAGESDQQRSPDKEELHCRALHPLAVDARPFGAEGLQPMRARFSR